MTRRLAVVVLMAVAAACDGGASLDTTVAPDTTPVATPPPTTTTRVPSTTSAPTSTVAGPLEVVAMPAVIEEAGLEARYSIPELAGHPLPGGAAAVNGELRREVEERLEEFRRWVVGLEFVVEELPSTFDAEYMVRLLDPEVVSIDFAFTYYASGAAHPTIEVAAFIFDLGTGRRLHLVDLVTGDSSPLAVATMAAQQVADAIYGGEVDEVWSWVGDEAALLEQASFWLSEDALGVSFSQYAVGPGAVGPVTVEIPFSALGVLIDPGGPIARLAGG